jgi:hypothetical protein
MAVDRLVKAGTASPSFSFLRSHLAVRLTQDLSLIVSPNPYPILR